MLEKARPSIETGNQSSRDRLKKASLSTETGNRNSRDRLEKARLSIETGKRSSRDRLERVRLAGKARLKKVQNNAARLITGLPNSSMSHLFSIPYKWLPTGKKRIDLKLAPLCFKSLNGSAPTYLSDLLHLYTPSRQLRSSTDIRVFRIPSVRTKSSGQHSFSYQAPTTWNPFPTSIRHAPFVSSFKSSWKTFLFSKTFSSLPLP